MDVRKESDMDEVIVYSPIGCPALNVRLADETIWLTMQQLSMVFGVDRSVIGKHIRNVYKTGELDREATWAKIAQVQIEGRRQVKRTLEYYNLDVVISVGYRVNSKRATQFRIWATNVIKAYLLRGKAENRELDDMKKYLANHEKRLSRVEQGVETIIQTLLPPPDPPRRRIGFGGDDDTPSKPYGKK
jgi:hypothetical protein